MATCAAEERFISYTLSRYITPTAIEAMTARFTVSDLERACPGVSRDMVRRVLRRLKESEQVQPLGRGPGALWEKSGNTLKKG